MLDPKFIEDLCCPETGQPLVLAESTLISQLNQAIAEQRLQNRTGDLIKEPIEGGLVRSDRQFLYPIRAQLPILLLDEAIQLR